MRNKNAKVSDPNKFVTASGDKYHIEYAPKIGDDGIIHLMESGKIDIQDSINSFRESCDMNWILQRLALGDTSVLNQSPPMYGDFTQAPKTYAEALQSIMDAEREFNKLPLDIRNEFDNDYRRWLSQAGSDSWLEKMGVKKDPVVVPAEDEKEVTE